MGKYNRDGFGEREKIGDRENRKSEGTYIFGVRAVIEAIKAEREINQLRNELRTSYLEQAEKGKYKFQSGIMYNDIFSSCEKVGDHIINVTEAVAGKI